MLSYSKTFIVKDKTLSCPKIIGGLCIDYEFIVKYKTQTLVSNNIDKEKLTYLCAYDLK